MKPQFIGKAMRAAVVCAAMTSLLMAGGPADKTERGGIAMRKPEPVYQVAAGLDGDVYPVFANFASLQRPRERKWGVVAVTINNHTDGPLRNRVAVKVSGWSDEEIQMAEMPAGGTRTLLFSPTFYSKLYENREIRAATAVVEVSDMAGRPIYSSTVPVRLRSAEDIYWGTKFKYAPFIASWVTPHDVNVERALSRAKEFMPGRRLPGYESWKTRAQQEKFTHLQAKAIYQSVAKHGVSYVKSSMTFGSNPEWSERVRMPRESLEGRSANCIDSAVMFASMFENLGMHPAIVIVPGHAYVGVRSAKGSSKMLYIDTALVGRVPFEEAVKAAGKGIAKFQPARVRRVVVTEARSQGIYPMP